MHFYFLKKIKKNWSCVSLFFLKKKGNLKKKIANMMLWFTSCKIHTKENPLEFDITLFCCVTFFCICICNGALLLLKMYVHTKNPVNAPPDIPMSEKHHDLHFHKVTMLSEQEKRLVHTCLKLMAKAVDQNQLPIHLSCVGTMLFVAINTRDIRD